MTRSFMYRAGAALMLTGVSVACGSRIQTVASPQPVVPAASTVDRMTARTGEQAVVVTWRRNSTASWTASRG
jgi:hypothetical protein